MDEASGPRCERTLLTAGFPNPGVGPVFIGAVSVFVSVLALLAIRNYVDFEALQWWVYINYDFTPRVNPFTIGPFLAGIIGGYLAGFLTSGLYENAIANAVKANLLGGALFYFSIVAHSIGRLLGSGMISGDVILVIIIQPLLFIGIPFTLVFMAEGVIAGPVGQFVRRRLPDQPDRTHHERSNSPYSIGMVSKSLTIILFLTIVAWAVLYSFYLFLTP